MRRIREGFALEEVLRVTGNREAYFWNTQGGVELDLLLFVDGKRFGFEFKYADAPSVTKSLAIARDDLGLARAFVVHPGATSYPLNEWAEAVAIGERALARGEAHGAASQPLSHRPSAALHVPSRHRAPRTCCLRSCRGRRPS